MCFGGIGSGKTSRFMLPMLSRLYNNDEFHAGGLVFDVKGDFYSDLQKLPKKAILTQSGSVSVRVKSLFHS